MVNEGICPLVGLLDCIAITYHSYVSSAVGEISSVAGTLYCTYEYQRLVVEIHEV